MKEVRMSIAQWKLAVSAAVVAALLLATAALAQKSPWSNAAPFPEPDEEYYGVAANGKMYVIGGFGGGKARGANYEYDPATDKWTRKKSMPRPAHHAALAAYQGKIYVFGGYVAPATGMAMVRWEPINNVWEYDPVADSWKALTSLPSKRGAAVAVEVSGKIYVIGGATTVEGAKGPTINIDGPARVLTIN